MPIFQKEAVYVKSPHPTFHTTPELPNTGRDSTLHVVTPIVNSCRYASRYSLFEKFEKMALDAGAELWVVEAAFGNRPYVVTNHEHHTHVHHIQTRTWSEIWHKESLINVGISRLPHDWEYVAWIDPDISFARPDWVNETLNQLQHFDVVQMFSTTQDLAPDFTVVREHKGFMYRYLNEGNDMLTITNYLGTKKKKPSYYAHPGYAWAARRKAINDLGGLIDFAILGSADWHMAFGLIGQMEQTLNPAWSPGFRSLMLEWQNRAERHVRHNVGMVDGLLMHYWHGRKKDRKYNERYRILVEHQYDPHVDLKRDSYGLWQLTDQGEERSIKLRDQIRTYFRSRNEDSIDVE